MAENVALSKNLTFWHWFPQMLVEGLTDEQLRWQPEHHDTSIIFALWHTYRAEDDILHGMVIGRPSVFVSQGWAARLPVERTGATPFGNGLTRDQIAGLRLDVREVLAYATAVGESELAYLSSASEQELASEIKLPFFSGVYPGVDAMSKAETIAFFAIAHTAEHLGEVQMLKGLIGLKGAPL